ncbi:MAG TPA: hypothetical protein VFX48_09935 [Saprospiraceae bacterium]|nr:hypothetical protein [Saprospiraceae bacterium]
MDFNTVRKWMQKMNAIMELYAAEESFTLSEKNLLLDYNQKIREAISGLKVEDAEAPAASAPAAEAPASPAAPPVAAPVAETVSSVKQAPVSNNRYSELFQLKKMEDLSEKLEATPITSILKAMGLNERILTQNELFGGEKSAFDSAIQKLNGMDHFEEAKAYLCDELIPRYDWMDETRMKKAQWFIKLIKRKYS